MSGNHGAADHHASAVVHHAQAVGHHREASRHYEVGKDYAHAAHQALVAHGHGLRAMDFGKEAETYYSQHAESVPARNPDPIPRFAKKSLQTPGTVEIALTCTDHHTAAANHHELAARHHREAAEHYEREDYTLAAQEAQIALGHAQQSIFHGNEAAKHHVEHYGKAGPTAEIS
jgi:hypothetical protein